MTAAKHKLDNLVVLVDYNKHTTYGPISEVLGLEPFKEKWESFGFTVTEVNGHSVPELRNALQQSSTGKPRVIICHTVKGKGIASMENDVTWHHKSSIDAAKTAEMYKAIEEYP